MCIDADYVVHIYMIIHTGGDISRVHGVFHEKASAQRLNTKISTEAGIVGVREYLLYNLWLIMFFMGRYME